MESEIPQIVYKYRDWNNPFHKNILLHNEIYLASPKDFNDPFDCKIPLNFTVLTKEERENYKEELSIRQRPNIGVSDLEYISIKKNLDDRMENIEKFQEDYEEFYFNQTDTNYGVFSLSKTFKGMLLWSHYANCHKGFCVGFWEGKLRESCDFINRTGIVKYNTEFPVLIPKVRETLEEKLARIHARTTTKSEEWEYEEEYRLIKAFVEPPLSFERREKIPDEVFSDVTLGIDISVENKKEIIEICRRKGILVYQAKKVPFKFEIDRVLIE